MENAPKLVRLAKVGMIIAWVLAALLALAALVTAVVWVTVLRVQVLYGAYMPDALVQIGMELVSTLGMAAVTFLLARLLGAMRKNETPFIAKNVKRLKKIALCFLMIGILGLVAQMLISVAGEMAVASVPVWGSLPMEGEAASVGVIGGADGPTSIFVAKSAGGMYSGNSLLMLLVAFAVYCVALVFEHGVRLQKLSDETL